MHTIVIQTWILLFVKNQCKNVPSGGIICGYCFLALSFFSCSLRPYVGSAAPLGAERRGRRAEWEGGLNFVGFSSTIGLRGGLMLDEEA